jgi:hypothetical protein
LLPSSPPRSAVERLREWKANEQANIIHMAAQLVGAGFKGDGDSIMSALDEALADRSALSARVEELEKALFMAQERMGTVLCVLHSDEHQARELLQEAVREARRALAPKEARNGE